MSSQKIVFIVGPTAVGKSELGLELARDFNGEIISCDSMQVYKEVVIASNKPSAKILKRIPHHCLDLVSVCEEFNVQKYHQHALQAIAQIHDRRKVPFVVGGSGLYMEVLLDGIFPDAGKDPGVREELERRVQKEGLQKLHKELVKVDPESAQQIHEHDHRRIIRALEVYSTTRTPISVLKQQREGLWGKFTISIFALNTDREQLYAKINERVDAMFERGIVDEVKSCQGIGISATAQGLIGIKEVLSYLRGECDLEKAKFLMKQNTRRFAKRQLTWLRRDERVRWMNISKEKDIKTVYEEIKGDIK